jgi:dihydroorotate dehydrogenase (fumarate)
MDLSIKYLGLELKSPIVVGSSGISNSIENLKKIEESGAGAVVLKSIFEEEIQHEYKHLMREETDVEGIALGYLDYYDYKIKEDNIKKYIQLIEQAKREINIPVIASVNCKSSFEWTFFAKKLQEAGADAIEVNLFILPSDFTMAKKCSRLTWMSSKRSKSR